MPDFLPSTVLSSRFSAALDRAMRLHGNQCRKGTAIPYVAHLLAVASIVLEHGGDEDEAIGALLHDTAEDCGGLPVLERVRLEFGARVADIVAACSDTFTKPKPLWHERKARYLQHLPHASPSAKLVCAADKLHNLRTTVEDVRRDGPAAMAKFNASADHVRWYYAACAHAVGDSVPPALRDALHKARADLDFLLAVPSSVQ